MKRMLGLTLLIAGLSLAGCKKEDAGGEQPATDKPAENPSAGKTTDQPATDDTAKAPTDQPTDQPAAEVVKTDTPEAKAQRYVACIGFMVEKNMDGFKGCFADDIKMVFVDQIPKVELTGPDQVLAYTQLFLNGMPDFKSVPQIVLANGDNIAAIALTTGTNSGDMGPMKATNKKFGAFEAHQVVMNAEGKATQITVWTDQVTMMSQLGLAPNPMSPDVKETGIVEATQTVVAKNDDAEKANVEQVKKAVDLLTKKDEKGYNDLVADDIKFASHASKMDLSGKEAFAKGLKEYLGMMKDPTNEVKNVWAAGDWVVADVHGKSTMAKDVPGLKGTKGKTLEGNSLHFFQLADGKIKQHHIFTNELPTMVQLGVVKEADILKMMGAPADGAAAPADGAAAPADEAKAGEEKKGEEAKAAPAGADKKTDKKAAKKDDEGGW